MDVPGQDTESILQQVAAAVKASADGLEAVLPSLVPDASADLIARHEDAAKFLNGLCEKYAVNDTIDSPPSDPALDDEEGVQGQLKFWRELTLPPFFFPCRTPRRSVRFRRRRIRAG